MPNLISPAKIQTSSDRDHGYQSNFLNIWKVVRYALDIPTITRETLPMQDLVGCDYFRTPVNFSGADIYLFVGAIPLFLFKKIQKKAIINRSCGSYHTKKRFV